MTDHGRPTMEELRAECAILEEMLLTLDRRVRILEERSTDRGWLPLKIDELRNTRRAALEHLVALRAHMARIEAAGE
jgi:antitoxin component of RelBE/YafQ-DinJ toxin-antitoxin module